MKGAPEALLPLCTTIREEDGTVGPLTGQRRRPIAGQADAFARQGLRVLAAAERQLAVGSRPPENREEAVDLQVGIGCETGRPL
ncbi:hypothetical protein ACFY1B_38585 [Streptomyces mirabilis]|uniref:hypothetical protein n=1 Tax=Streptomyces mirabilis TaxID=68239 RepID=UPI00367DEFCC